MLVFVEVPVGSLYMDFDATHPQHAVDRNAGFGKIRAGIGIALARAENGQRQILVGSQLFLFEILEAPDKTE
ncbi:hypothetical protein D3C87_1749440 [compost metagenome]